MMLNALAALMSWVIANVPPRFHGALAEALDSISDKIMEKAREVQDAHGSADIRDVMRKHKLNSLWPGLSQTWRMKR